jgi:predicted nucleic acid-binding protein
MPTDEVFLDASYAIALSVSSDQNHKKALALADELESNFTRLVTTRAVILEIGNALSSSAIGKRPESCCNLLKRIPEWRS